MMKLRFFALFTLLIIMMTGCSSDQSAGQIIRYDIASGVTNLDPQFATDPTARMIISNTFEGLFRQLPSGEIVPCIAKSYDVSPDGLIYTFYLRDDARWSDEKPATSTAPAKPASPVTAYDFEFALMRMFDRTAFSPFASEFSNVRNASLILSGAAPKTSLGVRALDAATLEIQLIRPDHLLPELLSSSYAMPCNQAFFESTRARYALDTSNLLVNGPFYIRTWNNDKVISLRQNKHYVSPDPPIAAGVDLYIPSKMAVASQASESSNSLFGDKPKSFDPLSRFLDGTTDACKVRYSIIPSVEKLGGSYVAYEDTVWVLALNGNLDYFANANIRKAIAHTINRDLFLPYLNSNLRTTTTLIPPVVGSMGTSFRDYAGNTSPITFNTVLAKEYYTAGLSELERSTLPLKEILVYDQDSFPMLAGFVQQNLQKHLSLPTGLIALPKDELLARVNAGDYQAAIIPISAAYASPDAILTYFKSTSGQNFSGYKNPAFDQLLASTARLDGAQQDAAYKQAEQTLLSDCAVIPLFYETTYYAMGKGVSDIAFSPFLSSIYFKNARKE